MAGGRITNQTYFPEQEEYFLIAHSALVKGNVVEVDFTSGTADSNWQPTTTKAADVDEIGGVFVLVMDDVASGDKVWCKAKGYMQALVASGVAQGEHLLADNSGSLVEAAGGTVDVKLIAIACQGRDSAGKAWVAFSGESGFGMALHTA